MSTVRSARSQYQLRQEINIQTIKKTVNKLNENKDFHRREKSVVAICDIVTAVHESYHNVDLQNQLIDNLIAILSNQPVAVHDRQIGKSALSKKPLIMQVLVLMQDVALRPKIKHFQTKLYWLAIALHTAVLLMHYNKKTHTHNILMQFKLAQFSQAATRTWIWHKLDKPNMNPADILSSLESILEPKDDFIRKKLLSDSAISQINKIIAAYQEAHYIKKNIKIIPITDVRPINLAAQSVNMVINYDQEEWEPNNSRFEGEDLATLSQFYTPIIESDEGDEGYEKLTPSFEETIDHYDAPFIGYEVTTDLPKGFSVPLQTIDLSLQQNYISQQELALNSNVRVLPKSSYQLLFSTLHQDAKTINGSDSCTCAQVLLLSMITALPVKSLIIPGYIGHSSIFKIGLDRIYIQHSLGITKRSDDFDSNKYENKFDVVKIPLPPWLINQILDQELPSQEQIQSYISSLRTKICLPYLSINRIETALRVTLSRYTENSNSHIADLICRSPASQAPAMYYSSHLSEEIFSHYKSALTVLGKDSHFDTSYITHWHKYTLGSGFALTINYVRSIILELQTWTTDSTDDNTHFNRTSILVWFAFCLLTGVRPNNGIGLMSDIDLDTGWLMIDDKPNRKVKSHRLIPLCATLIRLLKEYKNYLNHYQMSNLTKKNIRECVKAIEREESLELLRLLSESFDMLTIIKRGDAYHMTKDIIDANPYWTRHFVRSQLEKRGVDMVLINAVTGHEKARQEVLGRFSSLSKSQIKQVSFSFEAIANELGLNAINIQSYRYEQN